MALALWHIDSPFSTGAESQEPDPRTATLTDRLTRRLLDKARPARQSERGTVSLPRPTQLALPLDQDAQSGIDTLPTLFRQARRVEPVLSYGQAPLDQIVPDMSPGSSPAALTGDDELILPGGTGLILYERAGHALAFDWMQWGRKADPTGSHEHHDADATIDMAELSSGARAIRKRAQRRCVIPLTRFSVPVREGDVWSHRWITPAPGHFACAAGVLIAERGEQTRFAMVTGGGEQAGPMLLPEEDLLTWLRAPVRDAIGRLSRHVPTQG